MFVHCTDEWGREGDNWMSSEYRKYCKRNLNQEQEQAENCHDNKAAHKISCFTTKSLHVSWSTQKFISVSSVNSHFITEASTNSLLGEL
jgi:hypothetical protein